MSGNSSTLSIPIIYSSQAVFPNLRNATPWVAGTAVVTPMTVTARLYGLMCGVVLLLITWYAQHG